MTFEAPVVKRLTIQVDAVAAGSDGQFVLGEAPFAGTVTRAVYITAAAITGANTNTRTVTVTNRGHVDGSGTTAVAALPLVSGTNTVKDEPATIPLSGTAANLVVAQGDVLTVDSVHAASGLADPGGSVEVEISRT